MDRSDVLFLPRLLQHHETGSTIYFFLHCTRHFHPEMSTKMVTCSVANSANTFAFLDEIHIEGNCDFQFQIVWNCLHTQKLIQLNRQKLVTLGSHYIK